MNGVKANPDVQDGNGERGTWHKRLRLRKSSFSFPPEQNTVKEENKATTQEASNKPKINLQGLNTFACSECQNGISFKPAQLMMHFKIDHGGKGRPPEFPCSLCDFSTSVFATLQQHRMTHKDCLFACEVCQDNVQQTLPQLTKHCQTRHSQNGQYHCPKCKLSVKEIEQFICHSCSASNGSNTYGKLGEKSHLLKHMAAACRQRWSRRNWWRKRTPVCKNDSVLSEEFKFLLPKPEAHWRSTLLPLSTPGLLENHCVLLNPEQTLKETKQFLQRSVSGANKRPVSLKAEHDQMNPAPTGKDKLTGLMEKNNISVPPDCTTKVVGFKMVDGRKHLVLKVIPSSSVNAANQITRNESGHIPTSGNGLSQKTDQGRCAAQQRYLSSVVERINSQQEDAWRNQERPDPGCNSKPKDQHSCAKRVNDCQDEGLSESEENFPACQGDSGCHSDLTSDAGSLEERSSSRERNLALDLELHQVLPESLERISPPSPKSLCHFPSDDGGLLFHRSAGESTNNTHPREAELPVAQSDCGREAHSAPDLFQTVEELPLTTVSHLLDEVRADRRISSASGSDPPLKDPTRTADANQQSEQVNSLLREDSSSSSSVPEASADPIASLNRKRMGKTPLLASQEPVSKSQKHWASKDVSASVLYWEPAPRDASTILRLIPFSSAQSVKIPHDNQPVIVLNHPDADIPEVTNVMKVVRKHKGAVRRVRLSRKTLSALSEFHCDTFRNNLLANCHASHCRREWPNGNVKERFSLKLRLRRVCGRKYTVVPTASQSVVLQPTFRCWFCGRLFRNQEAWVGHGQRHLMEATRGWNQLFHRQDNPTVH